MTPVPARTNVDCHFVGDFSDEMPIPPAFAGQYVPVQDCPGVEVQTHHQFVDIFEGPQQVREFTVLLKDRSKLLVLGHRLTYLPPPTNSGGMGSYGILRQSYGKEDLIAVFGVQEVSGIFDGAIQH